ncbi:MAG: D-2-hydroxyacid dehydrogenase [Pseudomonadota bacterium]
MKLVINGAESASDLPDFDSSSIPGEVCFAPDQESLERHLPGADVLLGWNFRGKQLQQAWPHANQLKWIHWCGAGVDAVLFPELASSDVVLTNARGVFDRAMAEYVLGYMLFEVKKFRGTITAQSESRWQYTMSNRLLGQRAAVFGVGSIGREVARLLAAVGVEVIGVGRTERTDEQFGTVRSNADALQIAGEVDWIVGVLPSTSESDDFFTADFFAAMQAHARFINIGRGRAQDEGALVHALKSESIAGAMIDVFREEPLPQSSELWNAPNLFLSPHISGDYTEFEADMLTQFLDNLQRYVRGDALENVVDKNLGFVAS